MSGGEPRIVRADAAALPVVCAILREATAWTAAIGDPLWLPDEIAEEVVAPHVEAGLHFLAFVADEPAATLRFQLDDPHVWPEARDDSAFVHRLAVRRAFAGTGLSSALLGWAEARTLSLGRRYLRLDCEAHRDRLRALYLRHGFRFHDERRVEPFSDERVGPLQLARFEKDLARSPR